MTINSFRFSEADRLKALREHAILDTLPEPVFDDIARRAALLYEAPIALIGLVDEKRTWYKARFGFMLPEIPRSIGFEAHLLSSSAPLLVPDAAADERFLHDPLVTSHLNIRFYVGAVLRTQEGLPIGVLSVLDTIARDPTPSQMRAFADLAHQAMLHLAERRNAMTSEDRSNAKAETAISTADVEARTLLPDVIMRFSPHLRYSYVSAAIIDALGIRPDALLGREIGSERTGVPFAEALRKTAERTIATRRVQQFTFALKGPTGLQRFQSRVMPEIAEGRVQAVMSITRAIPSEPESMSDARPSLLASLGAALAEAPAMQPMLQQSASVLMTQLSLDSLKIWTLDTETHALALRATATPNEILISGQNAYTIPLAAEIVEDSARIVDIVALADEKESARTDAFRIVRPLTLDTTLVGIALLRASRAPEESKLRDLEEALRMIAGAIRNQRSTEILTDQATALTRETVDLRLALEEWEQSADNLAHELRTPINSVLGLTNLLLDTPLNAQQRDLAELTRSATRAMLSLIGDTLNEQDTTEQRSRSAIDLRAIVENIGAMLADRAQQKGLSLIVRCAPDMPESFLGDAEPIRRIITNLVSNGIKFTRQGYVLVDVSADHVGDHYAVSVDVEDSGVGISSDQLETIFDRKVQFPSGDPDTEAGMGLGLAISRDLAHRMLGDLTVESHPDRGSIFHLAFPLSPDPMAPSEGWLSEELAGKRALLVGGSSLQQYAIRELLNCWGIGVSLFEKPDEAIAEVQASRGKSEQIAFLLVDESALSAVEVAGLTALLDVAGSVRPRIIILTSFGRSPYLGGLSDRRFVAVTKPVRRKPLWEALHSAQAGAHALPAAPQDAAVPLASQGGAVPPSAAGSAATPVADTTLSAGRLNGAADSLPVNAQSASVTAVPARDERAPAGASGQPVADQIVARPFDTPQPKRSNEPPIPERSGQPLLGNGAERERLLSLPVDDSPTTSKALVIEDDAVNRRVTWLVLEKLGFRTDVASGGREAIELFETRNYDVVLIDCRMDGMDGYETARALRRMEGGERHTPMIAVSADTSPGILERCRQAGMDGYISKPVQPEALERELEQISNRRSQTSAPQQTSQIVDKTALLARVQGNREVLRTLVNLCRVECDMLMKDIRAAITSGDRGKFLSATHKLRGMISSIEAGTAVDAVRRLEETADSGRPSDAEALLDPLAAELDKLQHALQEITEEELLAGQ